VNISVLNQDQNLRVRWIVISWVGLQSLVLNFNCFFMIVQFRQLFCTLLLFQPQTTTAYCGLYAWDTFLRQYRHKLGKSLNIWKGSARLTETNNA
jgi:hypothetical protein